MKSRRFAKGTALLGLLFTSACTPATLAVNSATSEIYIIKGNKLHVCAVEGNKLNCPKAYDVP